MARVKPQAIQIGDNTHTQDQVITLQSFNTTKATVNKVDNDVLDVTTVLLISIFNTFTTFCRPFF